MKKTILATVLLSSLVLGASVSSAAQSEEPGALDTKGTITFKEADNGGKPPVIVDPENPGEGEEKPGEGGEEVKPPVIIDPENPGEPGEGGQTNPNKGPLKLEFAPNFNFGKVQIAASEKEYSARKLNNPNNNNKEMNLYAQLVDSRDASSKGWILNLKASEFVETGDFEEGAERKQLADGASLVFAQPTINSGFENKTETFAEGDQKVGIGADGVDIANSEVKGRSTVVFSKGVKLVVPTAVAQSAYKDTTYQSDLTWTLSSGSASKVAMGTPATK
ncbi:WxL domain-containing protein [Vagococcus intermedius]|uniref:WxL domain-containing protein n=1 Tax=Vagococcus intermedius TaxID=2991418 RepID=A0AAF0CV96_9ENTE|nr:WxL domain-containing protein [Vagococcus intermedius]WEG73599.1 WxL domain-containing protein [Vagococcus intermedius]WEG75683.1 WxL domain-containing protein [Vagococcus intermedius]